MCHIGGAVPDMCPFEEIATKRPRWASTVGQSEPGHNAISAMTRPFRALNSDSEAALRPCDVRALVT